MSIGVNSFERPGEAFTPPDFSVDVDRKTPAFIRIPERIVVKETMEGGKSY